jgi:hydroxyisourate hydrolase
MSSVEPPIQLSTHVLDAARGRPAAGVPVRWEALAADGAWALVGVATTDADGRVASDAWGPPPSDGDGARHRLVFDIATWAAAQGQEVFFPEVTITFVAGPDGGRSHVPLLLSPFAYSTYRGS